MEFIKKNWVKLTVATLLFLAGLVYLIYLCGTDMKIEVFKSSAFIIAGLVFFWGMTAYLIARMFDRSWAKYILLATGVVSTIFAACGLVHVIDTFGKLKVSMFDYLATTHAFTLLVVFGLIPLIKGAKKCCVCEKKEKAKVD